MPTIVTHVSPQGRRLSVPLTALLTGARRDLAREETNAWIKRLRLVQYGGQSMRQRFRYRNDSLWWFTELYLQKRRNLDAAVAAIVGFEAARDEFNPVRLIVDTPEAAVRDAAIAFGRATGIAIETAGPIVRPQNARLAGYVAGITAALSRLRSTPPLPPRAKMAAFVHTAFWAAGSGTPGHAEERYIGPVLSALARRIGAGNLSCVGVGPSRNFRARRWWDPVAGRTPERPLVTPIEQLAPRAALAGALEFWSRRPQLAREIVDGPGIRAAAMVRGCDLWPILRSELEGVALVQWPWSVRAMDEAGAALDWLGPSVALTYAEAGGWGRAMVMEARRRRIPSAGLQHGFIYRHWLNYLHEPDEIASDGSDPGFPLPDRTIVFDRYAEDHLHARGQFPHARVRVAGSPGLDALSERIAALTPDARRLVRHRYHVRGDDDRLLLLAAKFSEVERDLPALAAAVAALPHVRLVVRPHPAETAEVYLSVFRGVPNIDVATDDDLARLLGACDALVTMNSTVAIDGLVLGIPAVVIGLPNNLSPFVDAGVMAAGADDGLQRALETVLYDQAAREALVERGAAFAARYHMRADGQAAVRAADAILQLMT